NTFSASQPIRVSHGRVDTVPSVTSLPGYQFLPETEIPPQSWRPVGLAFLYTGGALVGTLGLESSSLGSGAKRELGLVGGAALVEYREVASGLRYRGSGFGGSLWARRDRLSVEAAVVRLSLDPADGSAATTGFTATQVDAWVAYDVAAYASVEVGVLHRSADPEFDAQSVGAVRVGARSFYEIGPGATVVFRAN